MSDHIPGCNMWHYQGGDYDRDCDACMEMAGEDQRHPEVGSMYQPADPIGSWTPRGPGTAQVIEMAALEVADDEVVCTECWLVHRPGRCDR